MDRTQLLIYADTHPGVGVGHLIRCLALAEAWSDQGGHSVVLTERWPTGFDMAAVGDGIDLVLAEGDDIVGQLGNLVTEHAPAWLVIDGYRLTPEAMAAVPRNRGRLAVLRDHGMAAPPADLIVDQNEGAQAIEYVHDAPDAVVLAGVEFALLRGSFRRTGDENEGANRPGLIMMGGTPSPAVLELVRGVIDHLDDHPVELLGAGFDADRLPPSALPLGVVSDPAPVMASRPWALTPSGSSVWELCCLGVPSVLFAAAPNQEGVGLAVAEAGAGTYLGPLEEVDERDVLAALTALIEDDQLRADMADRAEALVDGLGAARVVTELRAMLVELVEVTAAHAPLLFEWRNDPQVRAASFSSEPLAWDDHIDWLSRQMGEPGTVMFVAVVDDEPVGQVRFSTIAPSVLRVGVSLAAEARGRRLAAPVIVAGTRAALACTEATAVIAEVKTENERSAAAFDAAGYRRRGEADGVITFERQID